MKLLPSFERLLKTLHSWLGVLILPWVIVIGLTGIYLNHSKLINGLFDAPAYDEALFDVWPQPHPQDEQSTRLFGHELWSDEEPNKSELIRYHGRSAWRLSSNSHKLIMDVATGHYWIKTRFTRKTYNPDRELLHSKVYWGSIFKTVHERGWFNSGLGTWLADITAVAMVIFGLSGAFLFTVPRLRRRRNRLARRPGKQRLDNPELGRN